MRLTVEERVFILESYLKTMSYAHCRQSFFEKFRMQTPLKSAIAKTLKYSVKAEVSVKTRDTARYPNGYFISNIYSKYRLLV